LTSKKLIIAKMKSKINYMVKTHILISFVLNSVLYYAPSLGSNKKNTKKTQYAFKRGLFLSFGFKNKTSNSTIHNMSKEPFIPPIASFCVEAIILCFKK